MLLSLSPAMMLSTYRKTDAVIIVCQNQESQNIEIAALNDEATRVLGYNNAELMGQPISAILPERIATTVTEYVEFGQSENDLQAVLGKIRNFAVRGKDGREREYRLRIIRGESPSLDSAWFHLVLISEEQQKRSSAFRSLLKENFKGHEVIDPVYALPDRATLIKDIELVNHWVNTREITATFAVLEINHFDRMRLTYGDKNCERLYRHVSHTCKQKLREEDAIGIVSEKRIGILLIDAPQESARIVLNRLRWSLSVSPLDIAGKDPITPQVNIVFAEVEGDIAPNIMLEKCELFSRSITKQTGSIQLAIVRERREGEERRKASIAVEIDRRRKERRKGIRGLSVPQ